MVLDGLGTDISVSLEPHRKARNSGVSPYPAALAADGDNWFQVRTFEFLRRKGVHHCERCVNAMNR
jgi:hypothetical protein